MRVVGREGDDKLFNNFNCVDDTVNIEIIPKSLRPRTLAHRVIKGLLNLTCLAQIVLDQRSSFQMGFDRSVLSRKCCDAVSRCMVE